jgi:hypothetical protein
MSYSRDSVIRSLNSQFGKIIDEEWEDIDDVQLRKLSHSDLINMVTQLWNYV